MVHICSFPSFCSQVDSLGQTSLHWACNSGYPTTCEVLFQFGANPNIKDKSGETPLHKVHLLFISSFISFHLICNTPSLNGSVRCEAT